MHYTVIGFCHMTKCKITQRTHRSRLLNQRCSPQTPQLSKDAKPYNSGITLLCLHLQEEDKEQFLSKRND